MDEWPVGKAMISKWVLTPDEVVRLQTLGWKIVTEKKGHWGTNTLMEIDEEKYIRGMIAKNIRSRGILKMIIKPKRRVII